MHATHRIDVKDVITDAALEQRKLSWRPSSSRYYWESHRWGERREKFLKKHKDTVLFVEIQILIMIKNWDSNNLKRVYFIVIILH